VTRHHMPAEDFALLQTQTGEVTAILDKYIPEGRPVAILQFPLDGNVGNHMMWLAISKYLSGRKSPPAYVALEWDFDLDHMKRAIGEDGIILFLGGVTVSRLWPSHAEIKRTVAKACPGNRLISLPSTMLFVDEEDRQAAGAIFGDHDDVIMMARDPVSGASAREVFPAHVSVVTSHDSTFMLPPQARGSGKPAHDIIWLARDDQEGLDTTVPENVHVFDWPILDMGSATVLTARVSMKFRRQFPALYKPANAMVGASYGGITRHVMATGRTLMDEGKVLVTDRLHPHVLAALRGQPCVLLPDKFGKNRAVWEYSSRNYSAIHWADTPGDALSIARELAARD
jgi:exopolysaccharide biosynthesis predicted pyruvyltransferase EpsI